MSKKTMTISSKITGFRYGDQYNLKLFSSTGELVFDYSTSVFSPIKTPVQTKASYVDVQSSKKSEPLPEEVPFENLSAFALSSEVAEKNPIRAYFLATTLTIFLGGGAIVVYFIRKKKVTPEVGSDFKILDE